MLAAFALTVIGMETEPQAPGGYCGSQFPRFKSIVTWSHFLKQYTTVAARLFRTARLVVERKWKKGHRKGLGDKEP